MAVRQAAARAGSVWYWSGRGESTRGFVSTRRAAAEVTVTVDGKTVQIEQGSAVIQACEKAGVQIPRFCYHEKLQVAGNCRMCLVEVERAPKPIASCAMPVMPNMVIKTTTPVVHKAREGVMEFLLANHPLDCPICDQAGECDLQEQSMRYGSDRSRFHEATGKRAVEDKNIGPLVKTVMTRCIHCTRCVRFTNEVAGAPELGTTGRGADMQIGTYIEKAVETEMSGNIIDLCPVGALTSKPYAFRARPWELKKTESIDVHDAVGSAIRVDARGVEVMRVLPRLNDDINEEWINDKSRFACDGLRTQRLTTPLIRVGDRFEPASWEEVMEKIGDVYARLNPTGHEFKAIAGHLADAESMVALRDLVHRAGSENLAVDQPGGNTPLAHGVDVRSNYLFNSTINGIADADALLIVGSNPRHEASIINLRLRSKWLKSGLPIALVGEEFDSTFPYEHLGTDLTALKKALSATEFGGEVLSKVSKPMIIVGSAMAEHPNSKAIFATLGQFVNKHEAQFFSPAWNGYNVLQRAASRTAAFDLGFVTHDPTITQVTPKFLWLLGADELSPSDIPKDAFVIYQGHHGDLGAQYADIVLPGSAYTEKDATYVNTEGRAQQTRAATGPPGVARPDWQIIRAASEYLGLTLPYDDSHSLRLRMSEIAPHLVRVDAIEPSMMAAVGVKSQLLDANKGSKAASNSRAFLNPISDFYLTDVITRSSLTMARCSAVYTKKTVEEPQIAAFG